MDIAVLGTGTVGRTLAGRFDELGHTVVVGTRDPDATLARTEPAGRGGEPFAVWSAAHPAVRVDTFAAAAAAAEVVVNATPGEASLEALDLAGAEHLDGKVMLGPGALPETTSTLLSGNDADAKAVVGRLLAEMGHGDVIDLGEISAARGQEMLLPLWIRLMSTLGTPQFNFKIVR
jgi:predicted dinucleotide-binding enzyme